jgi:hypothetical protein
MAVRTIEDAALGGNLDRLGLQDDPERDVEAIARLKQAVTDRRKARVPAHLYELRDRYHRMSTFTRREC